MKKPALHQSHMGTLARCAMQYFYRYIENRITPPSSTLIRGTATHKTIERNLSSVARDGRTH